MPAFRRDIVSSFFYREGRHDVNVVCPESVHFRLVVSSSREDSSLGKPAGRENEVCSRLSCKGPR